MARNYGLIECVLWDDLHFRRLSDDGRLLLLYLRTCKHSYANAFILRPIYMMDDLRWDIPRIESAFRDVAVKPFALWDKRVDMIYIADWWRDEKNKIPNVNVAKGIASALLRLPECPLKARAIMDMRVTGYWSKTVECVLGGYSFTPEQEPLQLGTDMSQQLTLLPHMASTKLGLPAVQEVIPPRAAKAPKREGTRIDKDWLPTDQMLSWAREHGYGDDQIAGEQRKFIRYFTSDDCKKPVKKDWLGTWQNWFEKLRPAGKGNGNGATHESAAVVTYLPPDEAAWERRMVGWRKNRTWLGSWGPPPGEKYCKVPMHLLAPVPD